MTRCPFYAGVLMSGAVLVTGQALAPGRKDSFCLGAGAKIEESRQGD